MGEVARFGEDRERCGTSEDDRADRGARHEWRRSDDGAWDRAHRWAGKDGERDGPNDHLGPEGRREPGEDAARPRVDGERGAGGERSREPGLHPADGVRGEREIQRQERECDDLRFHARGRATDCNPPPSSGRDPSADPERLRARENDERRRMRERYKEERPWEWRYAIRGWAVRVESIPHASREMARVADRDERIVDRKSAHPKGKTERRRHPERPVEDVARGRTGAGGGRYQ